MCTYISDKGNESADSEAAGEQFPKTGSGRLALAVFAATIVAPVMAIAQTDSAKPETDVRQTTENRPPFMYVEAATDETRSLSRSSREQAARLVRLSREAFTRGLMSVEDYAERLANARRLEFAATAKSDRRRQSAILIQQVELWTHAVKHLASFRQPASGGWAADLAYARMMGAAAKSHMAQQSQDRQQYTASTRRRAEFATQQFRYRLADLDVGLASLTQLAESLSRLRQTVAAAELAGLDNAVRTRLGEQLRSGAGKVKERAVSLQERPAGIGRRDALQRVAYELALVEMHNSGDDDRKISGLKSADSAAAEMLATQHRVFAEGTASLADLIRSWRLQRDALESIQKLDKPEEPIQPERKSLDELKRLRSLADSVEDRRGRNAADVVFVANLQAQEQWKSIRARQWAEQKQAYDRR